MRSQKKNKKKDLKKTSVYDIYDEAYKILRDNPIKITPIKYVKDS